MVLDFNKLYNEHHLKINGVISIGSHDGSETKTFEDKGVNNFIYFEPSIKNFELLKGNITDNGNLYNIALGEENKKMILYVENNNGGMSSSLLKSKLHSVYYPHIVFSEFEEVDMMRLDDIVFDRSKFNFINMDVQGYELNVLQGFGDFLKNVKIIQFEYGGTFLDNNTKLIDVVNYLESKGFYKFSYLTNNGPVTITDFKDHYQYCNIVCINKNCDFVPF
jgi:FkbM family methyltransferase